MRIIPYLGLLVASALFLSGPSKSAFAAPKKPNKVFNSKKTKGKTLSAPENLSGVVTKINFSGNKKIELDAIKAKLKTKVGERLDSDTLRADIQSLFDMGYFYNIEVDRQRDGNGNELTFRLVEKPSITEVEFRGNDRVDKDDLQEASGVKQYTILDNNKIREAIEKMSKLYEEKGFFLARITYKVEDIKPGSEARVIFNIKENDKVKVKKVTFLGNRNLSDTKLKGYMQTQEGGFFSWLTSSGGYKQDVFDRDVAILNYVYINEGYIQVKIDRPEVYVTPDKKSIYITFRIDEGDQFRVGKVDFAGDLLFAKDELLEVTEIQKTEIFSSEVLKKDIQALQFKYGDLGYAYANPIPKTNVREKERLVDITYEVEKGQKVYFGQFTVTGNTKTRDKVVRRELKIKEGELYNETRRKKSEENVKRLGFFSDVVFNTSAPIDNPNIMNIEIQVKERSTGTLQVGAGYSSAQGAIFNGNISQTNLFGKGQYLALNVQLSNLATDFRLGFTEPYFNNTLWSVGGDLFYTKGGLGSSVYVTQERGADVRLGHPIAEYMNAYITYKYSNSEVFLSYYSDPNLYNVATASGYISSMTGSLVYDKRNDRWAPSAGFFSSLSVEQAGLGGDLKFTKGLANMRYYKEIFWKLVFRNNITYGLLATPNGVAAPFTQLFLLGGSQSLRGFPYGQVGKKSYANCCDYNPANIPPQTNFASPKLVPFGGTQELFYQAEIEYPLVTEAGIKGVFFYDIGTADDTIVLSQIKQDVGFGFRWFSPIGPLRFEWGFPINRQDGDVFQNFEFSIGSPF